MAKSNKKQAQAQIPKKDKKRRSRGQKTRSYSSDLHRDLNLIAQHIADPCNSDISASGLPGQKGFVSRFSYTDVSVIPAGQYLWTSVYPGALNYDGGYLTSSIATYTPNLFAIGGPGTPFFSGGAGYDFRCLGYCLEIMNTTNTMDRGGAWSALHTSVDQIHKVETTVNNWRSSSNERGSFGTNDTVMLKWRPGYLDDTYGIWNGAHDTKTEPSELSDKNALSVVISAPGQDQTVEIRHVAIVEWIPRIGLTGNGLVTPLVGASTHNVRSSQVASILDRQDPNWWFEVGKMAKSMVMPIAKNALQNLMSMSFT